MEPNIYLPTPPLPEGWEQDDHYFVHGIPTTQEKLVGLFVNSSRSDNTSQSKTSPVVNLLKEVAGKGAEHIRVIPCRIDESMAHPKTVIRSYPGGDAVLVLALDWTYEPGLAKRGLTEGEMQILIGYFGGEARWFKSCSTKKRWPIPTF